MQGRALNDEQLEAALQEMDADGNGTVDYEELETFILGTEQQDSESISGALQFALRRQLLAAQAKDLMSRLGFAGRKAPKGNVHIQTSFTTGKAFPVPSSGVSSDAQGSAADQQPPLSPAVDPPFKLHLQVGAEGDIASMKHLGTEEDESEAIQLVFGVGDSATSEEVQLMQRTLTEMLAKMCPLLEEMGVPVPVTRLQLEGPVPSPIAGTTGNAVVLNVFLNVGLANMLAERSELKELLESGPLEENDEDHGNVENGNAASETGEADLEGRKTDTQQVQEMMKRILPKLEVVMQANCSLEELVGGLTGDASAGSGPALWWDTPRAPEGGSLDVQTTVDVKISKATLQLLRTVAHIGTYRTRSSQDRTGGALRVIALALASGLDSIQSHLHFGAGRLLNLAATAGLRTTKPVPADISPARMLPVLLGGFVFHKLLGDFMLLDNTPSGLVDALARIMTGELRETPDPSVPMSVLSDETLSQLTSAEGGAFKEAVGGIYLGMLDWSSKHVLDIRSVRAAGGGLALLLQAKGVNVQAITDVLSSAHETRKVIVAQASKERAVPGLLVLACNPQYSAAIRGCTTQRADRDYCVPHYHIAESYLSNFSTQFQMTLRGIGAVDHCDIFEHMRRHVGGELVEAFQEGPEAFHGKAAEVLKRPLVLPPSGVRGPFGALLVLPASAFSADVAEFGTAADPAASSEVATAKAYIAAVQSRVAELNELFPTQPSEAMWTVAIDCHGGKVFPGLTKAVQSVLQLPRAQVAVADFGSSFGVTAALATAVQPVLKACSTPEYIALRAEGGLQLPE